MKVETGEGYHRALSESMSRAVPGPWVCVPGPCVVLRPSFVRVVSVVDQGRRTKDRTKHQERRTKDDATHNWKMLYPVPAQGIGTRASAANTWMVAEANGWVMNPSFTSSVSVSPG